MKVIVCFDDTRITVPCGNGDLLVKDLVGEAILRYKRATGKGPKVKLRVHTVKSVSDGAILDFNDHIVDVLDDREQIAALYEEEEEDELDVPLHGSDGMSAGSGSTDTWRPDSENSELNNLSLNHGINGEGRNPPVLNQNQRWHLERSGLIGDAAADDVNGIEIKEDDVNFKSDLALSVRHGSDSALENQKDDVGDSKQLKPSQPLLKRWSTAAAVHYSEAPEVTRGKMIVPLPIHTTKEVTKQREQQPSAPTSHKTDLSPAAAGSTYDKWPTSYHKSPSVAASAGSLKPDSSTAAEEEEESVVSVVPRPGEPVGLHLVPEHGTTGLRIQAIDTNSVAELSGRLHLNDRIVDVNGHRVDGLQFARAQEILRTAVAQGGAVKIRVSSAVAQTGTLQSSSASPSSDCPDEQQQQQQQQLKQDQEDLLRRKRTPPPLPPKPKLPPDLETMLLRANYEASLDYTPDVGSGGGGPGGVAENLYSYGSIRRPGRKLTIDLLKGTDGLGFTVTTRDNPAGTICPIYVKSILSKGAAFKDGRLKSGDRLVEVNGTDLSGKSQDEVVNLLRGIPLNTDVILVVARPETATLSPVLPRLLDGVSQSLLSENSQEAWEKNKEILTFDIPLNDSGSAGLGVRVTGKAKTVEGMETDGGIFVMNVIHGGAASKDGRLQPMDQLLSVDGLSLLGKNNQEAMDTLKNAMLEHGKSSPCMSITVARDLPLNQQRSQPVGIPSVAVPNANVSELNHIIRVPSQLNISSSPSSDISPPKPPRLYQNNNTMSSSTISGGKADPVLIEGDDSYADVSPTTVTSSTSTLLTHRRLDDLKDPYDADTSVAESDPFNRDGFARQSMSEKRHQHLDPRALETYRRSKAALAESNRVATAKSHTPSPSHATLETPEQQNLRRANSLESVVKGPTSAASGASGSGEGRRKSKGSAGRNRGCNESFRVAVDRSYDAERGDDELDQEKTPSPGKPRSDSKEDSIEILETSDRKQAKKPGFLRGWLRRSAKKEESVEVTSKIQVTRSTKLEDQATKARLDALDEQQRINVHLQKFKKDAQLQKQNGTAGAAHPVSSSDVRTPLKRAQPVAVEQRPMIVHIPAQGKNAKLPIALNGAHAVVTNDPYGHYMNYDEIQKILKRPTQQQQPSRQFPPPVQRQRPVSNYFEYGAPPPGPANGLPVHSNVRLGGGIYAQTTRPLGQIREISQEKVQHGRGGPDHIYGVAIRRGPVAAAPVVTPTAAALMGSQV